MKVWPPPRIDRPLTLVRSVSWPLGLPFPEHIRWAVTEGAWSATVGVMPAIIGPDERPDTAPQTYWPPGGLFIWFVDNTSTRKVFAKCQSARGDV